MTAQSKRLTGIVIGVGVILSIPLIAMQFTTEVDWDAFDFIVMGVLLLGTGLLIELALRKLKKLEHRLAAVAMLLFALFLIWAELAVGIFGSPFAGS